jgi:hypothetical protein
MIEFPVYSRMKPEYKKLSINRINSKFFSSERPVSKITRGVSKMALPKTPWGMIIYLLKKKPIKFDYCHMTSREMLLFLDAAVEETENKKYPLTMIGHSKEFFNDKHFIKFLDTVLDNGKTRFKTMGETINEI